MAAGTEEFLPTSVKHSNATHPPFPHEVDVRVEFTLDRNC